MHRYFFEISYDGSDFVGWQYQANGLSVQECIETQLAILLQYPSAIVGCGRTDAGVHARQYYFHIDLKEQWTENLTFRLNLMLPKSVSIQSVSQVHEQAHARFDATVRTYEYRVHFKKSPFLYRYSSYLPRLTNSDFIHLESFAKVFLDFKEFYPFCKSNSDVKTYRCTIGESRWKNNGDEWIYEISADRFLRGMVRLVVGAQLNLLKGDLSLAEIEEALGTQRRLEKNYAAPAQGLSLSKINYPYISG